MNLPVQTAAQSVYFVMGAKNHVKIGWSANVMARVSGLQVGASEPMRLIRVIDGGPATEAWLHRKFAGQRLRGEWFQFHEDMMTVIPPDEIPVRQKVTTRRDVRLSIKEQFASVEDASFIALSAREKLFLLSGKWTEQQSEEILQIIRSHLGLDQAEAA